MKIRLSEYVDTIRDRKIDVIGVGVSNTPLIIHLLRKGCRLTVRDKSPRDKLGAVADEIESLGGKLILGDGYLQNINADVIFRTPGLRPDLPQLIKARERGAVITSEMEVFFEVCPSKIIAVTGSDGKTTTTTIISELLRAAGYNVHLGGNIGNPLLCEADAMSREDITVLELSSFQLMTMRASPHLAVITNIAPNHLDIHRDMREYIDAKKNIFLYQKPSDKLVLNADNGIVSALSSEATGNVMFFSRKIIPENGICLSDGVICSVTDGVSRPIMYASDIRLPGVHNVENYMAAFAATFGLVRPDIQRRVATEFRGVEHRIEHVRTLRGVEYYNDSIASSPSRTTAGLHSFDKKVILIAGGKDKGVLFDELGREIVEHVKTLVVTGYTADKIAEAVTGAPGYKGSPDIIRREDFRDAVIAASESAKEGDIVILSPACTSFDHFRNFAERGEYFKKIVGELS
ncbi:MAG: UDP-N-acetylmuramoyl-L-alanine--D-glutamate ligase [Oscillospiraceae bacterium]